jgi:PadR family transcriptional regulator, regulatory protein PadR
MTALSLERFLVSGTGGTVRAADESGIEPVWFFYLCRHSCVNVCRVPVVRSRREFSPQTLSVLAALCEQPSRWQHGYALASQTGLKSGTLYPILIRLADRGLVEACWQDEPQPGRPRRHLYRLTPGGLASATAALAAAARRPAGRPAAAAGARQPGGRGAAAPAVP